MQLAMRIPMKKLSPKAKMFTYETAGAAAADMYALEDAVVFNGKRTLIKTGIAVQLPEGFVGMVCPRSGLALKKGITITNAPGIVDSDYMGDVGIIIDNQGDVTFDIKAGDRVAQFMIVPVPKVQFVEVEELKVTARGTGGFGSTGK